MQTNEVDAHSVSVPLAVFCEDDSHPHIPPKELYG